MVSFERSDGFKLPFPFSALNGKVKLTFCYIKPVDRIVERMSDNVNSEVDIYVDIYTT